jgi:MFS transporter, DHA2 family, multidrug resistance protein
MASPLPSDTSADPPPSATSREWLGLYVLAIACLLYSMDLSVLFLAIPSIVKDLAPSPTQILWMNDIYGFMVAGFLVTMGTLGDRIGRRRVLLYGAAAFGVASIFCAISSTANMLILSRALLGIAGATIAPSTLSLIVNMFQREDERNRAIGIWGTAFALGGLIGPVIGGVLLNWFHWGSVFLINVPIMVALLLAGPRLLPEYKSSESHPLDFISVAMSLLAILQVVYGLKQIAAYGLDEIAVAVIVLGLFFGWLFIQRQKTLDFPVVDPALFTSSRFNIALLCNLAGIFVAFATFMFQAQFFQQVLQLTPLEASLWSIPPSAMFAIMSLYSYKVTNRFGPEQTVIWGLLIFAVAIAAMAIAAAAHSLIGILASSIGIAVGFVPVILTTTGLIVGAAPPERAGSASAISETSAEFGGALGVAILGSLGTLYYRSVMITSDAPAAAKGSLSSAIEAAGTASPAWLDAARDAFADGYMLICVVSAAGLAVLAAVARRVFQK